MFKLTEEQIEEIIETYGGTKQIINIIEGKLNLIGVIDEEEDYYEVVASVAAQKETINFNIARYNRKEEKMDNFMSIDEIIELELNRKYNNFENSSPIIKEKIITYKRHN